MAHKEYRRERPESTGVVLFVHGIQGSPDQFIPFYDAVPDEWSIVNILLDGHGGGVRDFSRTSMKKWKTQVEKVTDELAERYENIVIAGHSMGTFFAMDTARRLPEKVRGLCLLCVPLTIAVKPRAGINSMRVVLTSPPDKNPVIAAARAAYSIELDKKMWRYIGWIPRYLELFREAGRQRKLIAELDLPCAVCQAARDELVSRRSEKYIAKNPRIDLSVLPSSGHFFFPEEDLSLMRGRLAAICGKGDQ